MRGQVDCDLQDLFANKGVSSFTNDIVGTVWGHLFCPQKQTVEYIFFSLLICFRDEDMEALSNDTSHIAPGVRERKEDQVCLMTKPILLEMCS